MLLTSSRERGSSSSGRWSVAAISLVLAVVLVAVNALAIGSIVNARQSTRTAARLDLELQTQVHARSFEALLANLRADLVFLSQSPPIAQLPTGPEPADPMVRRWLRLNGEGTLLLFLAANPAVDSVSIYDPEGNTTMLAGRLDGAPQILTPTVSPSPAKAGGASLLRSSWAIGNGERLEAQVDPTALLALAAPGVEGTLRLERSEPLPQPATDSDALWVAVPVVDDQWTPPVAWWLSRQESGGRLMRSLEDISRRYRTTLIFNLAVMLLTLALAIVAYRQVQRAAKLEAANQQQGQIRELERQLMHNERLATVGRLAAGIAHEINNPLEGMFNYLSVLEEDLNSGDPVAASQWVPKLRQGLDRSAAVTRQVLTFSDPAKAPREWVDLAAIVSETVDFVASNPAFGGVEIRRLDPPRPVEVWANRTTLGQLFLNILLNSCEAMFERDSDVEKLEGRDRSIEIVTTEDAGESSSGDLPTATITVSDHGPGFSDETLVHVFEPFYSGRGSSGLGMAVCYGIVRDLGGQIAAANRTTGGAEMKVILPIRAQAATNPPAEGSL
jgi:signal transduction histidine kinase